MNTDDAANDPTDRFPSPIRATGGGGEHEASTRAVYVISVAAELAGVHPQTLRVYERKGLVDPSRTGGGNRRYSQRDIERLRRIQDLTAAGLNLEGVRRVLELEAEVERLRAELDRVRAEARDDRRADAPPVPARPGAAAPGIRRRGRTRYRRAPRDRRR